MSFWQSKSYSEIGIIKFNQWMNSKFMTELKKFSFLFSIVILPFVLLMIHLKPYDVNNSLKLSNVNNNDLLFFAIPFSCALLFEFFTMLSQKLKNNILEKDRKQIKEKLVAYLKKQDSNQEYKKYLTQINLVSILARLPQKIKEYPNNYPLYLNQINDTNSLNSNTEELVNILLNNPQNFVEDNKINLNKSEEEIKKMCEDIILNEIDSKNNEKLKQDLTYFLEEKNNPLFKKKNLLNMYL